MHLLLLEALAVLGIAIFIVWWTMFSGRGKADAAAPVGDEAARGDGRDSGDTGTTSNAPKGHGPSGSTGGGPGVD
jgi:hypothetical protein